MKPWIILIRNPFTSHNFFFITDANQSNGHKNISVNLFRANYRPNGTRASPKSIRTTLKSTIYNIVTYRKCGKSAVVFDRRKFRSHGPARRGRTRRGAARGVRAKLNRWWGGQRDARRGGTGAPPVHKRYPRAAGSVRVRLSHKEALIVTYR